VDVVIQVDEPFDKKINPTKIDDALSVTFQLYPPQVDGTVSVVITNNDTVQHLNRNYRGIDAPTDVLSFDNIPDPNFLGEEISQHLGDIVIAYPVAEKQAIAGGHSVGEEVQLLTVHGALHLLGFDHDTSDNRQEMWTAQGRVMAELDLAHVQPTEN
jgi:probable rRNA maturation factor